MLEFFFCGVMGSQPAHLDMCHPTTNLVIIVLLVIFRYVKCKAAERSDGVQLQATPNLPPSEMDALRDFYFSCNGPHWNAHVGRKWNFTENANPCTQHWQGIICRLVSPYYHVHSLNLALTNVAGTLPHSLVNLTQMTIFSAIINKINGTIPAFMGNMTNLQVIDLSVNYLTGSIPASLGNLRELQSMDFSENRLTGRIPESFGDLASLGAISLGSNNLSGPIPTALGKLRKMQTLHFYHNYLTGTIPLALCNFTKAIIFDFGVNSLTGSIPAAVGNMSFMVSLYLYGNQLTGVIPESIASMSNMGNLELYSNYLTGPIPNIVGNMHRMEILALYNNSLSGTIPNAIRNMSMLEYLYIDSNHFTGTLPACVGNMTALVMIDIHANHIEGTIPAFVTNSSIMTYVVLHHNLMTGRIPASVANLSRLVLFQVQNNQLSGSLQGLFSAEKHTHLTTIQVNNNQLTGSLPAEVFLLPILTTFAAVSNCFEGRLPLIVCNSSQLQTLVLDGLSSAKTCRDTLLPGISGSYVTQSSIYGTIPQCLFTHGALTTLHLSGNGFTGTLPSGNITIGAALVDLTLSHNLLSGHIPPIFQLREWLNIDLSYNKFGGTLLANFSSLIVNATTNNSSAFIIPPSLFLATNRLSGHIPATVRKKLNISMLGTNVFSCRLDRSDLPQHDSGRENYQCGSDSFEVPYYVWLALALLLAVAGAVLLVLARYARLSGAEDAPLLHKIIDWVKVEVDLPNITGVQRVLLLFRDISLWSTVYILLVLLPLYCVLKHWYGTLTHQYAWGVSAAYMSGVVPVAWELSLWVLLLCVVLALFLYLQRWVEFCVPVGPCTSSSIVPPVSESPAPQPVISAAKSVAIAALFISINLIVVVGVNSAYVYVAIYQSSTLLLIAQILISLFKIAWNNVCTALILRQIVKHLIGAGSDAEFVSLQVFVALLNNIAIPCLVVAMVSPDCFYNVFVSAPSVSSQFSYPSCVLNDNFDCETFQMNLVDTLYEPPFRYRYQCSASFITYYAPAFVILCLVVTFVNPALQLLMLYWYQRATAGSLWWKLLDTMLPRILKPISTDSTSTAAATPALDRNALYFDANRVLIIVVTFFGLLLTFGALFPPLAVAICLTVLSVVYWAKFKLGRFLSAAQEQQLQGYVQVVERECAQVGSSAVLHNSMWMLLSVSCCFYTLFLFDTLGDSVGFEDALWVLIVTPLVPLILYAMFCGFRYRRLLVPSNVKAQSAEDVGPTERDTEYELGSYDRKLASSVETSQVTLNILLQP